MISASVKAAGRRYGVRLLASGLLAAGLLTAQSALLAGAASAESATPAARVTDDVVSTRNSPFGYDDWAVFVGGLGPGGIWGGGIGWDD